MARSVVLLTAGACMLGLIGSSLRAQTTQLSYRFDSLPEPPDTLLYDDATITGGYLRLTAAQGGQIGTFIVDSLPKERRLASVKIGFLLRINKGGSSVPADGFSVNFGPQLLQGSVGEDGVDQGLAVTFDLYDNGGDDSAPAIEVKWDGQVIDGVSMTGGNRNRGYFWPLTTATPSSIANGTTFIPVQVWIKDEGTVTVSWNDQVVLDAVPIPYEASKGWRLAFGARTGGFYSEQSIDNLEIETTDVVQVAVNSEYGQDLVSPPPGVNTYTANKLQQFHFPDYIYMDRYGNELQPTAENIQNRAFSRARLTGSTVTGVSNRSGDGNQFQATLAEDTTVDLTWAVEYLGAVYTGTENIQGLSENDVTPPEYVSTLGVNFYGQGAARGENFRSVVNAVISDANALIPVRFASSGLVLENTPGSSDRFVELSGRGEHFRSEATGADRLKIGGTSFTVDFWARRNAVASGSLQGVLAVGDYAGVAVPGQQFRVGFSAAGGLFLGDSAQSETPTVPAAMTDNGYWHHWTIVNDLTGGEVRYFRDGELVFLSSDTVSYGGNDALTVGAGFQSGVVQGAYGGGLNNLRIWPGALDVSQIQSLRSLSLASGSTGLQADGAPAVEPVLEVTFDGVQTQGGGGLLTTIMEFERDVAYATAVSAPTDSDGDSFPDAVEAANGSDAGNPDSIPSGGALWVSTHLFTGGDEGEGLDLEGHFPYAINFGNEVVGRIRDAAFRRFDYPGVTLDLPNSAEGWNSPSLGSSANDLALNKIISSIRWYPSSPSSSAGSVTLSGLNSTSVYKLQLLFQEACCDRGFDVRLNGTTLWKDFNPGVQQGGIGVKDAGVVLSCELTVPGSTLQVVLDGAPTSFGDKSPILCGLTLEEIPAELHERIANSVPARYEITPQVQVPASLTAGGEDPNYFALVEEGDLLILEGMDADYTFYLTSDDGSSLEIDGELLILNDGLHGDVTQTATVHLNARRHPIVVKMFEQAGGQSLSLEWEAPSLGIARQPIPLQFLKLSIGDFYEFGNASIAGIMADGSSLPLFADAFQELFPGTIDPATMLRAVSPTFSYEPMSVGNGGDATSQKVSSDSYQMQTWARAFWQFQKEFELQINVAMADGSTGPGLSAASLLPFISSSLDQPVTGGTGSSFVGGVLTAASAWVKEGRPHVIGTRFMTPDRRYSLHGVQSAINGFSGINMDTLEDGYRGAAATRQYFIPAVTAPGKLTFLYDKTLFQAVIPIGQGLDGSDIATVNAQLTPDLPDDVQGLIIDLDGPLAQQEVRGTPDLNDLPPLTVANGDPWQWDFVNGTWNPLHPGPYVVTWKSTAGEQFTMEVFAEFPGEVDEIPDVLDREKEDGSRQGTKPDYMASVAFDPVDLEFPGAPVSHYNYLVSPNSSDLLQAATDPLDDDRWAFRRLAYSENDTALVTSDTAYFTEPTAEVRSVMVFSYQVDPETPAGETLDLAHEGIRVRIVKSYAPDGHQVQASATVAQRIESELDTAGFGTGYVVWENSNYNPQIYSRDARAVGDWGSLYPVNDSVLFQAASRRLQVGYYENPHLTESAGGTVHPDAEWPYVLANYDDVAFDAGAGTIYIASRLGSEGVGAGDIYLPDESENLSVYNQPDRSLPGYNPNEEHALVAPSIQSELTGDPSVDQGQSAFFALQNRLNQINRDQPSSYTSEPYVLAQYQDALTGEWLMKSYRVEAEKVTGVVFPALDPITHLPVDSDGQPVPQPLDPAYTFDYTAFAGDALIPPYPLSLLVVSAPEENTGGNIITGGVQSRALWRDKDGEPWVVSGDGEFFYRNCYPMDSTFWFFDQTAAQRLVAWLPEGAATAAGATTATDFLPGTGVYPQAVTYRTFWRDDYPVLKRGETLTYQGGENIEDHPSSKGLPSVVGMAAVEMVFDSGTPDMRITSADFEVGYGSGSSARVVRPLGQYEAELSQEELPEDLLPGSTKLLAAGAKWYFTELPGDLQRRFFYDPLQQHLVFEGLLDGMELGDPELTQKPIGPYLLQPNVLSREDFEAIIAIGGGNAAWNSAVGDIYQQAQDPDDVASVLGVAPAASEADAPVYLSGLETYSQTSGYSQFDYFDAADLRAVVQVAQGDVAPLRSLGTGAALVPSPQLLTKATGEPRYIVLAENNREELTSPVALHVIEIGNPRFRGMVEVVEPANVFDEKINLNHTADFGGYKENIYFEWWMHDIADLSTLPTPDQPGAIGAGQWTLLAAGQGKQSITFEGRPDVTLADKLFYVRYGTMEELAAAGGSTNSPWSEATWRLVSPTEIAPDWSAGVAGGTVPYQWAGAANSPQLQADGSRIFLPQLVMGWVKRILDRINPYEARYSGTFSGDSPATFSSQLTEAGRPFVGPVALNPDKRNLETVGLIELYETVLQRAKELTDAPGAATDGTNQALLLAATRLMQLYQLLGMEAYSDAKMSGLTLGRDPETGSDLAQMNGYLFAFRNQVPDLLDEELALLRGTDFLKAYPVYNRLMWNYVKGLGEAAYNANYDIWDVTHDGLIDESDAAGLYPMGHGDAWGHLLMASRMHYELLLRSSFDWQARSELYYLLGNVLPTDYLDEASFAQAAANRLRAGMEIIEGTYRQSWVADPEGQWQGYTDAADPARGWGVSEWSGRVGHGAYFDWLVGNAILPLEATMPDGEPAEGLDQLDREANKADLVAIAAGLSEVQTQLERINDGSNPLGMDPEALLFGLDPVLLGGEAAPGRKTHFEQVYSMAVQAGDNARSALDALSEASLQLRETNEGTRELQEKAILQDLEYRGQLIEIFGMPYSGTIGAGKIYPEGYYGPDLLTYMYMPAVEVEQIIPQADNPGGQPDYYLNARAIAQDLDVDTLFGLGVIDDWSRDSLMDRYFITGQNLPSVTVGDDSTGSILAATVPIRRTADYAFLADPSWGNRAAQGELQVALNELLLADAELGLELKGYNRYLRELELAVVSARDSLEILNVKDAVLKSQLGITDALDTTLTVLKFYQAGVKRAADLAKAAGDAIKPSAGAGGAIASVPQAVVGVSGEVIEGAADVSEKWVSSAVDIQTLVAELIKEQLALEVGLSNQAMNNRQAVIGQLQGIGLKLASEANMREGVGVAIQRLQMAASKYESLREEGARLVQERTALNKMIAAAAQQNRYTDMAVRLARNEHSTRYNNALDAALRYSWLAARVYDYETGLSGDHAGSVEHLLEEIVRERQLGRWENGEPKPGNAGLADLLYELAANYGALKGQLGLNNPQDEVAALSLRKGHFRIQDSGSSRSAQLWREALSSSRVSDVNAIKEFRMYCRPFAEPELGPQPALVLEFATSIEPGKNAFGSPLAPGDSSWSSAMFATKIGSVAVSFSGYDVADGTGQSLSATPRVYLVPVGGDRMRTSDAMVPSVKEWQLVNQRVPVPYPLKEEAFADLSYLPSQDVKNVSWVQRARYPDMLALPDPLGDATRSLDESYYSSVLLGRSAWNTRWLLIIPGASLGASPQASIDRFVQTVDDIRLHFRTYSHSGL